MRTLMFWDQGIDNPAIDRMVEELNIEYCAYYVNAGDAATSRKNFEPLYISLDINKVRKNISKAIPIDEDLLEKMSYYEQICCDVIWRARRVFIDDYRYSYRLIKEAYYDLLRYWNDIIVRKRINSFIFWTIPHVPNTFIPYAIACAKGLAVMTEDILPIHNKGKMNSFLTPRIAGIDAGYNERVKELYKNESLIFPDFVEQYFDEYTGKADNNRRKLGDLDDKNNVRLLSSTKQVVTKAAKYVTSGKYKRLKNAVRARLRNTYEEEQLKSYIAKIEEQPVEGEKYIYFALHMQPEATSMPSAWWFSDQMLAIDIIAKSLPKGMKLYIKEHPVYWMTKRAEGMSEGRSINFYNNIRRLKNVRLISHEADSDRLTDNCFAVATLRGTAGFESLFKGKPVLVFAGVFYENFKGVYRIRSVEDCILAIKEIGKGNAHYSEYDLRVHLAAMDKYRCEMGINGTEEYMLKEGFVKKTQEDIDGVVDCIIRFWKDYYSETVSG